MRSSHQDVVALKRSMPWWSCATKCQAGRLPSGRFSARALAHTCAWRLWRCARPPAAGPALSGWRTSQTASRKPNRGKPTAPVACRAGNSPAHFAQRAGCAPAPAAVAMSLPRGSRSRSPARSPGAALSEVEGRGEEDVMSESSFEDSDWDARAPSASADRDEFASVVEERRLAEVEERAHWEACVRRRS